MKKIILHILLGALLLIIMLNGGCWDRRELESLGLIQALGLDLGPEGKGVTVTVMIAIPPKIAGGGQSGGGGGGGGGSESGVFTISMSAPTIYESFNKINTTINREATLIQNTALLIGEDLAKQGIQKWVDTLVRFREMRRTMLIFVTKGKAASVMKVQPKMEKNPAEYFTDLANLSYRNGMFPVVTLNSFMNSFEAFAQENYAPIMEPYQPIETEPPVKQPKPDQKAQKKPEGDQKPTSNEQNIRIVGTAIFNNGKMVGNFDIYESQVLELLTGQFREALLSVSDPFHKNDQIAYRLLATGPPIIKYKHGQTDHFKINLKLEADILSIQSRTNYTAPKMEVLLGKHIARELKQRILRVINKTQTDYNSDVFGIGKIVRSTMLTSTAWDNYHWPDRFPTADIKVNVKVALRRVGVQFQPPESR